MKKNVTGNFRDQLVFNGNKNRILEAKLEDGNSTNVVVALLKDFDINVDNYVVDGIVDGYGELTKKAIPKKQWREASKRAARTMQKWQQEDEQEQSFARHLNSEND